MDVLQWGYRCQNTLSLKATFKGPTEGATGTTRQGKEENTESPSVASSRRKSGRSTTAHRYRPEPQETGTEGGPGEGRREKNVKPQDGLPEKQSERNRT